MRLPLHAWDTTLRKLGFRRVRRKTPRYRKTRQPQLEVLERREVMATQITSIGLLNDTGSSSSDLVTQDPTLTLSVTGDWTGRAEIEFDHGGDEMADDMLEFWSPGSATFDPRNTNSELQYYNGPVTVHYRWVEYDDMSVQVGAGSWTPFDFTLEQPPDPEADVYDESYIGIADGTGSVDFGTTTVGSTVSQTFTIENAGTTDLEIDLNSITVPSGFTVTQLPAATVSAFNSSTTFTVRLDAAAAGTYSGELSFASNDADESPYTFQLSGVVETAEPEIDVLDDSSISIPDGGGPIDFGTALVGEMAYRSFTIENWGVADLSIDLNSFVVPAGFTVTQWPAATVSPGGGQTSFTIELDTTAAGNYSGEFSFESNDTDEAIYSFTLSGIVDAGEAEISLLDEYSSDVTDGTGVVDFGSTFVGTPLTKMFTIENRGTADLEINLSSFVVPAGFAVTQWPAATVSSNGGQTYFTVEMPATAAGLWSDVFSFETNDPDEGLFNFTLSGAAEVAVPEIEIWDGSNRPLVDGAGLASFGATQIDTPVSRSFTVRNVGTAALDLDFEAAVLPAGYSLVDWYGTVVEPGSEIYFTVQLDAAAAGAFSGEFSLPTSDADENPFQILLGGQVVEQTLDALPQVTIGRTAGELQTVVIPAALGGTWRLGLGANSTVLLPLGATSADVQTALEFLPNVGFGNVTVTGQGTVASPFSVQFRGALLGVDVPELTFDGTGLDSVLQPTATVTTETEGEDGTNAKVSFSIDTIGANSFLASGSVRFYYGTWIPDPNGFTGFPHQSSAVAWNASTAAIEQAIEAIPNVLEAGGEVVVTELQSHPMLRRLQVEFQGGLVNRRIDEFRVFRDVIDPVLDDQGNEANIAVGFLMQGAPGDTSEVQRVALAHAQGGQFRLGFLGENTVLLDLDADAAAIEQALSALSTIGTNNVEVTGEAGGPWRLEFLGELEGRALPPVTVDTSLITGGAAIIETVTGGATGVDAVRSAIEGGRNGYVRVFRAGSTAEQLVVRYTVSSTLGTPTGAVAGADFQTLSGSVIIAAGSDSADIVVRAIDDVDVENLEGFQVTLSEPVGTVEQDPNFELGATTAASVSILNNDFMGPRPAISVDQIQHASEGGGAGYVRLSRSDTGNAVTVSYRIETTSTARPSDYQPLTGTVTIPAGQSTADIAIAAIDDLRSEGTEEIHLTLTEADQLVYVFSGPLTAVVEIADDEPFVDPNHPVVSLASKVSATEGGTAGRFTLARTGNLAEPLTIDYAINWFSGLAEIGVDFAYTPGTSEASPTAGSVTFPAGAATVDVLITAENDFTAEGSEAVHLWILESGTGEYSLGSGINGSIVINDGNGAPPPLTAPLSLVNDTGESSTDKITHDPRVAGTVTGNFTSGTAKVLFDHNADFVADGEVIVTPANPSFEYDPRVIDPEYAEMPGGRFFYYRIVTLDETGQTSGIFRWTSFTFQLIDDPDAGAPRLVDVRLERDTGTAGDDLTTSSPVLLGTVHGDFAGGSVRAEFDHYGNDSVDGSIALAESGLAFRYDPAAVDPSVVGLEGPFIIKYRLVTIDAAQNETVGPWTTLQLTLEPPPTSSLSITSVYVDLQSESEFAAGNPLLVGQVTATAAPATANQAPDPFAGFDDPDLGESLSITFTQASYAQIELDFDADGQADEHATADEAGRFSFSLLELGYGTFTVRVRPVEWSSEHGTKLYGPWISRTFTLDPAPPPAIVSLEQAASTAGSTLVAVVGQVELSGLDPLGLRVQFDHNGDDVIDGTVTLEEDGSFRYEPRQLPSGEVNLRARTTRWDSVLDEEIASGWYDLSIWRNEPAGPAIASLELYLDTGENENDGETSVSTLVGDVSGASGLEGVEIQFDHDGNGSIDGVAHAQDDGAFLYEPLGLVPGAQNVRARSAVWDENGETYAYSDWFALPFELVPAPNAAVAVSLLALRTRTGGTEAAPITTDPTLVGQLENDGNVGYLTVEFDHNNDGTPDGTTTSAASGSFQYLPSGLSTGSRSIAARAREWNDAQQQWLVGGWTTLSFELIAETNLAPIVQELALLSDSGSSPTDGYTANATLVGRVADDRSAAQLTVEFDHDGDGVVDGVAVTDADGNFQYEPSALAYGAVAMRARVVEWNASASQYQRGGWTTLNFHHEQQANAPAVLAELQLGDPLDNADPTRRSFRGRVTNEGALQGVIVEFDFDSNGSVDQSATTDASGRFTLQPQGLSFGTINFQVRTRESDPVTHAAVVSAWLPQSINYAAAELPTAEVLELELVNDNGWYPDDGSTTDPRVAGTIDQLGSGSFVIVQFDHNGDDDPEGQVVVGSDLAFTYTPADVEVGNITLRARTKDYDHNGAVVYGAWLSLPFYLEELVDQPLVIEQLGLASDTGASATDGATSDSSLSGQVTGAASNETVSLEIDLDGDGDVDMTESVGSGGGSFSVWQPELPDGLNTVYVRAVAGEGETSRSGDWMSFSFALSDDPDGAAAQDLAAVAASLNASAAASQSGYQAAVDAADDDHEEADEQASDEYDDAVATAIQTRNGAVSQATGDYEDAIAAADAAYQTALEAAAAALTADLAAYAGDTTSFDFQPFAWPEAPAAERLQVPDDASQPRPPATGPQYSGPEFRWQAAPGYQQAKAIAEFAYYSAVRSAGDTLDAAKRNAKDVYDQAVRVANDDYRQTMAQAEEQYRQALNDNSGAPVDLQQAHQDHNETSRNAWETYKDNVDTLRDSYRNSRQSAQQALNNTIEAAGETYRDTVEPAYEDYMDVASDPDATPAEVRNAYINYRQIAFDASKQNGLDVSDARRAYDQSVNSAYQSQQKGLASAWETYQTTVSNSLKSLDNKVATYNQWLENRQISAKAALESARIGAEQTRIKAIASAEQVRADVVANAQRDYDIAVATATANKWQAEVTARGNAYLAWHQAVNTPWSSYQLALVTHEAALVAAHAQAHVVRATALANATRVETQAINAATKTRAHNRADANATLASERLGAKSGYWQALAAARKTHADSNAAARHTYRNALSAENKANAHFAADEYYANADERSEAYYNSAQSTINARQFIVSSDPDSPDYWGREYTDPHDLVNISATLSSTLAQADYDYRVALLGQSETTQKNRIDIASTLRDSLRQASLQEAEDRGLALETYQKNIAKADKKHAVQTVKDNGIERGALALAHVNYVGVQVLADEAYADEVARIRQIQQVNEATSERTFHTAAAGAFVSLIGSWSLSLGTRWSAYQYDLAYAEQLRATAAADAKVIYVTSISLADKGRAMAVADAERILTTAQAGASKVRTDALVVADDQFATAMGADRLIYAEKLAELMREKGDAANAAAHQLEDDRENFEAGERKESIAIETDYQEAQAAASLTYQLASIAAGKALALADHSESAQNQYEADMEAANDDYNDSMEQAWDALRTARAANIGQRAAFYARLPQRYQDIWDNQSDLWAGERGVIELALAAAIKNHTIALASAVANADVAYATTVAGAGLAYDNNVAAADLTHRGLVKTAELTQTVALDGVSSDKRENDVASRGWYEAGLYSDHASDLAAAHSVEQTELSAFKSAVAQADATMAETLRLARDAYQFALSNASNGYTLAVASAEQLLSNQTINAEAVYRNAASTAQANLSLATATADASLYHAGVSADAVHDEQQVIHRVTYDNAKATALAALKSSVSQAADGYAADLAAAAEQHYLDSTDDWQPHENGYYGGYYGGYGYGGYGWYGGWYGFGGYAGYVFGPWSGEWGYGGWYGWSGYYGGYYGGIAFDWGGFYGGWYGYGWDWYYGYGYGYGSGPDQAANEAYSDAMSDAGDAYASAIEPALTTYVTAIGDAQIARATNLGDANITLATSRGNAAGAYRTAVQNAETAAISTEITAANTRRSALAGYQATYTTSVAGAKQTKVAADENANVALKYDEGVIAVAAAGSRATAEATYHYAKALAEGGSLQVIADTTEHVELITVAGPVVVGEKWSVTIGASTIEYTAAAATVADVVNGLVALLNDAGAPVEFADFTWSGDNVAGTITATALTPGVTYVVGASTDSYAGSMIDTAQVPQEQFDVLYANAFADWIDDLSADFVTRETAKASADAARAYNLALAWRARTNSREAANYQFTIDTAALAASRVASEAAVQQTFEGLARGYEIARENAHQQNLGALEISTATIAKNDAVALATIEKDYHLDLLAEEGAGALTYGYYAYYDYYGAFGYGFDVTDTQAWQDRKVAQANRQLAETTAQEDLKLAFQQAESLARQTYSGNLALAERDRALALTPIAQTAAQSEANYQAAVDGVFANAERAYWVDETAIANIHRADTAAADVAYWTAEESDRVAAANAVDDELETPWSDFLVAAASAHANWWSGISDDYVQWIADRNTAESNWQANVNAAHLIQTNAQITAKGNLAYASANSARTRDDLLANARHTYVAALLAPAKSYVDSTAQAHRNHAVATATAYRDYTLDESPQRETTYQNALNTASSTRQNALATAKNGYSSAEAAALSTKLTTEGNAENSYTLSVAFVKHAHDTTFANAFHDFKEAEARAYVTLIANEALIDKNYAVLQASSLKGMAEGLASDPGTASPWATQHASSQTGYDTWSSSASGALESKRSAIAQARAGLHSDLTPSGGGQIAVADSVRDVEIAAADANYNQAIAIAGAALAAANAEAAAAAALGGSGGFGIKFPVLSAVNLVSEYAVPSASSGDYYVNVSTTYGHGWGCGFGWGWGWGGCGYYGAYYFDYYGYYGFGYGYSGYYEFGGGWGSSLAEPPQLALPWGFWNLQAQAESITAPTLSSVRRLALSAFESHLVPVSGLDAAPLPTVAVAPYVPEQPPSAETPATPSDSVGGGFFSVESGPVTKIIAAHSIAPAIAPLKASDFASFHVDPISPSSLAKDHSDPPLPEIQFVAAPRATFDSIKVPGTQTEIVVEIFATGGRFQDMAEAKKQALEKFGKQFGKLPVELAIKGNTFHHKAFDPTTGKMTMQLVSGTIHTGTNHSGAFSDFVQWLAKLKTDSKSLDKLPFELLVAANNAINKAATLDNLAPHLSEKKTNALRAALKKSLNARFAINTARKGAIVLDNVDGRTLRTLQYLSKSKRILGGAARLAVDNAGKLIPVVSIVVAAGVAGYVASAQGADVKTILSEAGFAAMNDLSGADTAKLVFEIVYVEGSHIVARHLIKPGGPHLKMLQRNFGQTGNQRDLEWLNEQVDLINHYLEKTNVQE